MKTNIFIIYIALFTAFLSCGSKSEKTDTLPSPPPQEQNTYINPVFKPILADPTVIKDVSSDYYYAYGTEDYWTTDYKDHLIAIVKSKDLINWTYAGDAFASKPTWKSDGGIWAPDINYIDGKYYLYYAYSVWADGNPGVGLAIATSPAGPFTDQGKMFLSNEVGIPNAIDPYYTEDNGKKYLFVGSYSNSSKGGIYGLELSADGKSVPDTSKKFRITYADYEGAIIHRHGSYYYFFGSKNNCCDGAISNYQVRMGRSVNITGPYIDKDGHNLLDEGSGTLILQRNSKFAGPGHTSRVLTDKDGQDWILYHAMNVNNAVINGVNQRALMLDKITWDANGWPVINDGTPSTTAITKPAL